MKTTPFLFALFFTFPS
ncbi:MULTISPECIES: pheA operon leader peptide PheL [Kosakonia]|nr:MULTISPECIES: pheA operon leader peptide PheL [Kosakonia]MBS5775591.1 pheA operon leader peptide PheL [Enterobacter cloacae]MDH2914401.1 pheA operon leader peptide PheL [Kosakonia sp. HypNH10]MDM9616755.1 pheA operon leader peptide PheL [Kosakonia cowanii]MDP4561604.1 pheA operon leader peptide PheL [Kosakonia cowanii]MDY0889991.1 pheA operon leader peptide PheL [Kosakonia sp. CFBP8986]